MNSDNAQRKEPELTT